MGWWKIDSEEYGGIDWSHKDHGLVNASPSDPKENYYNGDGPADIMDDALIEILQTLGYKKSEAKKISYGEKKIDLFSKDELVAILYRRQIPNRYSDKKNTILDIVSTAWQEVNREYAQEWNRPPFPEEKKAVINFSINPMFEE